MNINDLIQKIEEHFWCMQGPSRAYFELKSPPPYLTSQRFRYQTLRYGIISNNKAEAEDKLCNFLFNQLPKVEDRKKEEFLFWRLAGKIETESFWHWEDCDPETKVVLVNNPRRVHTIYTRLIIPGYHLEETAEGSLLSLI